MFDAYRIGVTLSLTNHVSKGLMLMAGDFAKTEAQAAALQKRIDTIKSNALKGGMYLGAGVGMLALFKAPLEEAKKFEQQVAKFKFFGMTDEQNAEAVKFARNMNIVGSSIRENMKLMTEAQGVFRESGLSGTAALDGAKLAAPMLAKIALATASLDEATKAKMQTQSLAMLRFVEMRGGLKDVDTFNRIADSGWKAIQSSGGNVNWEQLRQFQARGGVAAQGLSDRGLYGQLEPVIGELKGSTAGNAIMTAYNRLIGGVKVPNQVAHLLASSGIWDAKKITWNSMGGIKSFSGNPLRDMELLTKSPVDFYEQKILPMYAKMNHGKGLTQEERSRENLMIFGRTGGAMFSLIDRQMATIDRSVQAWDKAMGVNASAGIAGKTLAGKEIDFHAKFSNLMLALGETVLPLACRALEKLIPLVKSTAEWIDRNHTLVKGLVYAFTALAGGLMIRGSVLLLASAFRGLGLALALEKAGGLAGIASLGTRLTGAATGLGALTRAAGLFMAAYAGWKIGGFLNENVINPLIQKLPGASKDETLGTYAYKLINRNENVLPAPKPRSDSNAPVIHNHIHIDSKEVASVMMPKKSLGPTNINPLSWQVAPGMNVGMP